MSTKCSAALMCLSLEAKYGAEIARAYLTDLLVVLSPESSQKCFSSEAIQKVFKRALDEHGISYSQEGGNFIIHKTPEVRNVVISYLKGEMPRS